MIRGRPRQVHWVDAFTQMPFSGNPAVVVLDAEGLRDAQMQQLAQEVNCSETAFILPSALAEADLRLRWFTPTLEVNLCGHATVAAMHTLAQEGRCNLRSGVSQQLHVETRSGVLPVTVDYRHPPAPWIWLTLPRCDFQPIAPTLHQHLLDILQIPAETSDQQAVVDSTNQDVLIAVERLDQLHQLHPDLTRLAQVGQAQGWRGFCVYTTETVDAHNTAHTRFFAPQSGIDEDPVTGSVSAPLALYLHHVQSLDQSSPQDRRGGSPGVDFTFEQGDSMGRPGRLRVQLRDGIPELGGQAVTLFKGQLCL